MIISHEVAWSYKRSALNSRYKPQPHSRVSSTTNGLWKEITTQASLVQLLT